MSALVSLCQDFGKKGGETAGREGCVIAHHLCFVPYSSIPSLLSHWVASNLCRVPTPMGLLLRGGEEEGKSGLVQYSSGVGKVPRWEAIGVALSRGRRDIEYVSNSTNGLGEQFILPKVPLTR